MEVHMNEWAFNQGMVGYKRILDYFGLTVPTTANGIIVKKEHLEQLPDAYFTYFLAKMNVAKQNERSLRSWHSQWKKGKKFNTISNVIKKKKNILSKLIIG